MVKTELYYEWEGSFDIYHQNFKFHKLIIFGDTCWCGKKGKFEKDLDKRNSMYAWGVYFKHSLFQLGRHGIIHFRCHQHDLEDYPISFRRLDKGRLTCMECFPRQGDPDVVAWKNIIGFDYLEYPEDE